MNRRPAGEQLRCRSFALCHPCHPSLPFKDHSLSFSLSLSFSPTPPPLPPSLSVVLNVFVSLGSSSPPSLIKHEECSEILMCRGARELWRPLKGPTQSGTRGHYSVAWSGPEPDPGSGFEGMNSGTVLSRVSPEVRVVIQPESVPACRGQRLADPGPASPIQAVADPSEVTWEESVA